jgi:hypothetical protein
MTTLRDDAIMSYRHPGERALGCGGRDVGENGRSRHADDGPPRLNVRTVV